MADDIFGLDGSTYPDLDPSFAPLLGLRAIGEALARRFETPRGLLPYDPDYGLDLRAWIGEDFDPRTTFQLRAQIEAEAEKDERILSATASVDASHAAQTLTIQLSVSTAEGSFALTLAIDRVSAAVLSLQEIA
jgi:hypothetical protein